MVVDDVSRRVVGQLIPPGAYAVRLTVGDRVIEELTDGLGRFTFEPVAPGPVRITVEDLDGGHASTEWVLL